MNERLRTELKAARWQSGTWRGFLRTSRAGIEFEVGPATRADDENIELRWRYHGSDGSETLSGDATLARIEDVMTGIYLRIHPKAEASRVFGGRRRSGSASSRGNRPASVSTENAALPDPAQETLDL